MKLSSMFPTTKTLAAPTAPTAKASGSIPQPKALAGIMKPKRKPGEFNIAWPKMPMQGVKDYKAIINVAQLKEYIARCASTGLGGFDYETAADRWERDRFAKYKLDMEARKAAAQEGDDAKVVAKALEALAKEYEAELKEHKRTPLDPWKSEVCAMSLAAAPNEARAIFIDNPGRNIFEPNLSRSAARKLLFDTLEEFFFTSPKIMKIAVNLNFEQKTTAKYGKYILMPVADPFLMWIRILQIVAPHKIKNPKAPYSGKGLKPMTKEYFGVNMDEFTAVLARHKADFFDEVPNDHPDSLSYCCEDSDYAVQHYLYWDEVAKQIPNANDVCKTYSDWLHTIEMPFARVTGLMEYWGMYWDNNLSEVKRQEAAIMQEEAAKTIADIAKATHDMEINVGAAGKTKDVKSYIFDTLKVPAASWSDKTGDPSLDGNALLDMIFMLENKLVSLDEEKYLGVELPEGWETIDAEKDPSLDKATRQRVRIAQREPHEFRDQAIELFRTMQKIQKYATLLSSHIEGREKYLHPVTNRIHAEYQPWTETSRLSSRNPNGQNVPRPDNDDLGIRNFYRAPEGKVLFMIDEAGFELRLIAWKSLDEVMLDIFRNNGDMHKRTAATLTGKPESEVTKHERSDAKSGNFGITYGGTEHALQKTLKKYGIRKSLDECLKIVNAVKATYPRIVEYQRAAIIESRETGYAETILGYKRLLPNINSGNGRSRGEDERRAGNTPIQGSAACVMKKAQNGVYEKIGLDTASINLGRSMEVWDGFDAETYSLLTETPVIMQHGKTDMIAQIHDEIIFELVEEIEKVKAVAAFVKSLMEIPPLPGFPVPLQADTSVAYSWGNKKDLADWLADKGEAV